MPPRIEGLRALEVSWSLDRGLPLSRMEGWRALEVSWSLDRGLPLSKMEGWRALEVSWSLNRGLPLRRIEGLPASYADYGPDRPALNRFEQPNMNGDYLLTQTPQASDTEAKFPTNFSSRRGRDDDDMYAFSYEPGYDILIKSA